MIEGFTAFSPQTAVQGSGLNTEYFEGSIALEEKNFWFVSKGALLAWVVHTFAPNAQKYFEAGCGTGFFLKLFERTFPSMELLGSDLFIEGLRNASKRIDRSHLVQMDLEAVPYSEEFDMIGIFDVLEHVDDHAEVLSQLYNALKPGGTIIITVPQHRFLWTWIDDFLCHKRRYNRKQLSTLVRRSGFGIVRQTSFTSLLFPFMVLSRTGQKLFPPEKPKPEVDLKINPVLNTIFGKVMTIERMLIQKGISFPFGGSILCVAKKTLKQEDQSGNGR